LQNQELAAGGSAGCTSEAQIANAGTVEARATALVGFSAGDRARLAAMLLAQQPEGKMGDNAVAHTGVSWRRGGGC
jgi:hypothetical protein